jgi:hypothetical protein
MKVRSTKTDCNEAVPTVDGINIIDELASSNPKAKTAKPPLRHASGSPVTAAQNNDS